MHFFSVATFVTAAGLLLFFQEMTARQDEKSQRFVSFPLVRLEAENAAKKLKATLGTKVEIAADKATNTVLIQGNDADIKRAKELIKQWDVPSFLYIIYLKNADCAKTVISLSIALHLLAWLGDDRDVWVSTAEKGEAILIHASEAKAKEVKEMIRRLDMKPR
jgi:type II secretory pathway component GspD/PulD (secretin)